MDSSIKLYWKFHLRFYFIFSLIETYGDNFLSGKKKMNLKGNRILNTQVHRNHGSVIFQRNQSKNLVNLAPDFAAFLWKWNCLTMSPTGGISWD